MTPTWTQQWGVPTPFPVGDVNAWYLPGRVPSLIDPGPKTREASAKLDAFLTRHPVRRVLFTHHHVDHAGLAAKLQRERGVEVAAHRVEAEILAHWGEGAAQRTADYAEGLVRAGVPEAHRERMRYGGMKIESYAETVNSDLRLDEGDRVTLGDRDFEVLHCPGHTAGSMLLCAPDRSATFSGDTLLARITPNALSVRASERGALVEYLATLDRLKRQRLGTILPGHGPTFKDAPAVIAAAQRHADVRQARIERILAERPGDAFDIARRLFLQLPDDQLFLAVSETLGHLEYLRRHGRVDVQTMEGVDVYGRASRPTVPL